MLAWLRLSALLILTHLELSERSWSSGSSVLRGILGLGRILLFFGTHDRSVNLAIDCAVSVRWLEKTGEESLAGRLLR